MPIRITGMNSGLDTETIIKELASAKEYKKTKLEKEQKKLGWKQEAWKSMNTKIYSFYTTTLSDMRFETAFMKKTTTCSNANAVSITASDSAPQSTQMLKVDKLAKSAYLTGAQLGGGTAGYTGATTMSELGITADTSFDVTVGGTTKTINLTADTTIDSVVSQLKEAGLTASFDAKNQRMYVSAAKPGAADNFTFGGDTAALTALGLTGGDSNKIEGQDAEIILNGVKYTSNDNVFEVNGLTITAKEETATEMSISTTTDTTGIYDMVKKFIKGYNELINEMDKMYNAASSKGYEPLTDEEREAISETEAEQWEKKIKDSLLRKDATLDSVASVMKDVMAQGVTMEDGSQMYLYNFGIDTLGYFTSAENEKYAYHIDGDKDDSSTSGNEDKLRALIAAEPEKVTEFFTKLTDNLYNTLTKKMDRVEGMSSAFTVYNDKLMQEEYDEYTEKIAAQQKKVDEYMDRYYAKFSAMETALAQLQSKQNAVSQLLGM